MDKEGQALRGAGSGPSLASVNGGRLPPTSTVASSCPGRDMFARVGCGKGLRWPRGRAVPPAAPGVYGDALCPLLCVSVCEGNAGPRGRMAAMGHFHYLSVFLSLIARLKSFHLLPLSPTPGGSWLPAGAPAGHPVLRQGPRLGDPVGDTGALRCLLMTTNLLRARWKRRRACLASPGPGGRLGRG